MHPFIRSRDHGLVDVDDEAELHVALLHALVRLVGVAGVDDLLMYGVCLMHGG